MVNRTSSSSWLSSTRGGTGNPFSWRALPSLICILQQHIISSGRAQQARCPRWRAAGASAHEGLGQLLDRGCLGQGHTGGMAFVVEHQRLRGRHQRSEPASELRAAENVAVENDGLPCSIERAFERASVEL